jgi:enamine deaminase RidA (YjgF/YER057c/UK114 family)
VVKLTVFLVDATHLPVVREVRDQYINTQQRPASTAVEVRRLVRDDLLIEIEAGAMAGLLAGLSGARGNHPSESIVTSISAG